MMKGEVEEENDTKQMDQTELFREDTNLGRFMFRNLKKYKGAKLSLNEARF